MRDRESQKKIYPLQFAVMCNGTAFQKWQADAIQELRSHGHKLILLIRDARSMPDRKLPKRKPKKKFRTLLFSFLENRMFKPEAREMVDLSAELEGIITLPCGIRTKGCSEYFYDPEVEAIKTFNLDFILRFGFGILRGDILNAAKFGVWSFHHDDEMAYRGGPAGFWEIMNNDNVNGAILQRLTNRLDAGMILRKGYLKTVHHSYKGNINQLLSISSSWPARVADEITRFPADFQELSPTDAPIYKIPDNLTMIRFLFKLFFNRVRFYYKELVAAEVWNVGLIRKPVHEVALEGARLKSSDIQWLRHFGETKYLADPFGFIERRKLHIMVEDYSYSKQKASISEIIYDLSRDSFSVPIRVIEEDEHLSYPCIVEDDGNIYCIPESYRAAQIVLYRRNYSEEAFMEETVLLSGIEAVDPTIFSHNGLWWLLFTTKKFSTTHLFVYYAEKITGPFLPHLRNPVKIDIRSARPGGFPFYYEGNLYRPAQDCSLTYGGSIVINRIVRLTPDEFTEEIVNRIGPVKGTPFDKGLHTLSGVGNFTLIDGKKYRINRFFFMSQMSEKLKKDYSENA